MLVDRLDIEEVLRRISIITAHQAKCWSRARGWAPDAAADLLDRARLDRQASLARSLRLWLMPPVAEDAEAQLILAWANLGAVVEGTMKLCLTVWYETYQADSSAIHDNAGDLRSPEVLMLEGLRTYFQKSVWSEDNKILWRDWVLLIQHRRNAIHAFADKEIGTHAEFLETVRRYLVFLDDIDGTLPYHDDWGRLEWPEPLLEASAPWDK